MPRGFLESKFHFLRYYYHGTGLVGVLWRSLPKLFASIYHREAYYVTVRDISRNGPLQRCRAKPGGAEIECVVLESSQALSSLQGKFPSSFRHSEQDLKKYLDRKCIVVLARLPETRDTESEVVGYGIAERGVFSAFGRTGMLPSDIVFSYYIEVLPAYRGWGVAVTIASAKDTYCQSIGVKKRYSTIRMYNRPSLLAVQRAGQQVVGIIERVSLLGGLVTWGTPWEQIEAIFRR